MREADRLADLVDAVIDGDPWHGPNAMAVLEGIGPREAAAHVVPGAHSMWELVLHMTAWTREVTARLGGAPAGDPAAGDWPAVEATTADAWSGAVAGLVDSHRVLAAAIRAGDSVLDVPVADPREPAAGTGLSRYLTLHGLVHHTAYHCGQLAMLKRALATGRAQADPPGAIGPC